MTFHSWEGWTLRWSPNGQYIGALGYEKPGAQNVAVAVRASGKQLIRLTPEAEQNYKEGLEWHPDGQRLTYF